MNPVQNTAKGKGDRKKPTKKASPIGKKGKSKAIAKRPTKTKAANQPVMGNSGKIAWKRFGM